MTVVHPGLVAGRYRLGALLGRGGMAEVYSAHDEVLDRAVAIKLLRNPADPMHRARFGSEASTLAVLHHPHVVTLVDAGLDGEMPFLAMQLISGATLSAHAARGPLDRDFVRRVGAQVAEALAHAHAAGVVHRDVKPSNILIDEEGRAFLTDFGIAHLLGSLDRHTRADELVGSPAFLAPEQVEAGELTAAADVYSLGLVLLEVLTGERAYPGSPVEAAIARLRVAPLIPTSLGPELCRLLEQMTRLNPEDRPTAAQVAQALDGRSPLLPPYSEATGTLALTRPAQAPVAERRRNRWLIGSAAAAAAAAALLVPVVAAGSQEAPSPAATTKSVAAGSTPVLAASTPAAKARPVAAEQVNRPARSTSPQHKDVRPAKVRKAPRAGHHAKGRR